MTSRRTLFIFAAGAFAMGQLSADTAGIQPGIRPVESTHTENVNFAPGGTIRVNNASGNLSIDGWDQPNIEITVVKSMGYDPKPPQQAAMRLDSVKVVTERRSDTEFAITTTRARTYNRFTHALGIGRDPAVEYRIRVPRNSHLIVNHAEGFVSVTGVTGNIEADNRRGDIVLMLPELGAYSIDAHTKVGLVTSDLAGSSRRKHLTGEEFSYGDSALTHRLQLRMGFGGITIKELPPEALAPVPAAAR